MITIHRIAIASMTLLAAALAATPAAVQAKPAVVVVELDVRQPEAFAKEFFPVVAKIFADAGGTFLVRPSPPTAVDDVAPKRVAIIRFESKEKALATLASPA